MIRQGRHPLIALLLSVMPGLGQLYNAQPMKGLVIAGSCVALALGCWWLSGLNRFSAALALVLVWSGAMVDAYKTAQTAGQPLDWYYRPPYVIAMLLLVGPLALPLLWRSPHFSLTARWTWTALVLGVVLLVLATPYLLHQALQQLPELKILLEQVGVRP